MIVDCHNCCLLQLLTLLLLQQLLQSRALLHYSWGRRHRRASSGQFGNSRQMLLSVPFEIGDHSIYFPSRKNYCRRYILQLVKLATGLISSSSGWRCDVLPAPSTLTEYIFSAGAQRSCFNDSLWTGAFCRVAYVLLTLRCRFGRVFRFSGLNIWLFMLVSAIGGRSAPKDGFRRAMLRRCRRSWRPEDASSPVDSSPALSGSPSSLCRQLPSSTVRPRDRQRLLWFRVIRCRQDGFCRPTDQLIRHIAHAGRVGRFTCSRPR